MNTTSGTSINSPPRVVILGGGYGGVYTALKLQRAARRRRIELTLISKDNFFLFQPMLAEVVSGSIEPPHIVNPIRRLLRHTNFHQAAIEGINLQAREVIIRHPGQSRYRSIPYDHLVIAVGRSTDLSSMPGMAEHAFPFKTLGDALFLRSHLIGLLERAEVEDDPERKERLLTFVVAGGGYTGVEAAAEINDFIREAAGSFPHVDPDDAKVILLHGGDRILPALSADLADFSHRLLERSGLEIRLNTRIRGATGESASLDDGSTIYTHTLVAAVGTGPNRVLDNLPFERDRIGRLVTDENLAMPGYPGVWALGDCASVTDFRTKETLPPTAQVAVKEARHLAKNIMAAIDGKPMKPLTYRSLGVFVPLGRFSAAAEVMGLKLSGFPAWWLYRSYYLLQLPRLKRKLQVMMDWTISLIFRRDIVKIDIARSEGLLRAHYEPGELIFRQDELAENFYVITTGEVEIFREMDGLHQTVATLRAGEYFGEMSLLEGGRHTASARAQTPVNIVVMSGSDFTTLNNSSSRFHELIAGVMRERTSSTGASDGGPNG